MGISKAPDDWRSAPQPLSGEHDLTEFDSGVRPLDDWLRRRALANEAGGASHTFVVCQNLRVIGYYSLSAFAVSHQLATTSLRRNMPDPIPMMLLGRLAVDCNWRGKGLGGGLLKDAVLRTIEVSAEVGMRGLLVHAVTEEAKGFYLKYGFSVSPVDRMTLMVRLSDIVRTIQSAR